MRKGVGVGWHQYFTSVYGINYKFKTVFGISWYFDQHLVVGRIVDSNNFTTSDINTYHKYCLSPFN